MISIWRVTLIPLFVLFSSIGLSEGRRTFLDTPSGSRGAKPFSSSYSGCADIGGAAEPLALLEGLRVQDGAMLPPFDPNTLHYTVILPPGTTALQIIPQVPLGKGNEKYNVKTISNIPHLVTSPSRLNVTVSVTPVEVKVSADKHQCVTYNLEVRQALQGRSNVWEVLFQILFWVGIVVAVGVVGVFVFSIYWALSGGGVTGEGVQGYISRGEEEQYEAIHDAERVGNGTT